MEALIKIVISIIFIPIILFTSVSDNNISTKKEVNKDALDLLKIEEASSFNFIHMRTISTNEAFYCLELKFEISVQDYDKNELEYGDASDNDMLFDCNYIEKQEGNIYTCVVRCTDEYNKELYNKFKEFIEK